MSKRLLLINDRRSIARTIRSVAPELDLEIVALDNVTRAAARVTELQPDVVVLDVRVAAHELIELLRNIVQTGTNAKIVITTRGDDPTARMTEGLARFHIGEHLSFLREPFHRRRISAFLRDMLHGAVSLAASVAAYMVPEQQTVTARVRAAGDRA
jgi:DNA-binding NtrC family response regulator